MSTVRKAKAEKEPRQDNAEERGHWAYDVEMHRKIEVEAYLMAEKEGFAASPYDYWLKAEQEVGSSMP